MTRTPPTDLYSRIRVAMFEIDAGPTEDELEAAPLLRDWAVADLPVRGIHLAGHAHGHPQLPEGASITTSRLLAIDPEGRWAHALSRWYRLGPPMVQYPKGDVRRLADALGEQLERLRAGLPPLQ